MLELRKLVNPDHHSMPVCDRELLSIGYFLHGMDNKSLQQHMLTADATIVANTMMDIKEYLAVSRVDRLSCKIVEETVRLRLLVGVLMLV